LRLCTGVFEVEMPATHAAKLFTDGLVMRLPSGFHLEGDAVYATRDDATGNVTLSTRPGAKTWNELFEFMRTIDVPADFRADRPMSALPGEWVSASEDRRPALSPGRESD
jgi:antitoxin VapB